MNITVVVLNYNDWQTTKNFLCMVSTYRTVSNIIVVDNCSTDDSVQQLGRYCVGNIKLLISDKNNGYAAGNNVGAKYAVAHCRSDVIIISNPDIEIKEADIKKIIEPLSCGFGMTTGLIYNYSKADNQRSLASNFAWKVPNYWQMLNNCFLISYKIIRLANRGIYLNYKQHKNEKWIQAQAVPGCFFAITTEALKRVEYFDEDTFLFGEETILGWRLKEQKINVCVVNDTEILHENSVSINKNIKQSNKKVQYLLSSELLYLQKYLKCGAIKCALFKRVFDIGTMEKQAIQYLCCKNRSVRNSVDERKKN